MVFSCSRASFHAWESCENTSMWNFFHFACVFQFFIVSLHLISEIIFTTV